MKPVLRQYEDTQATVLPDLDKLPGHWQVQRLKTLFVENDHRTVTGGETLLSLRMSRGLVPHNDVSEKFIEANALIGYKHVTVGQLVMNRMQASNGLFATVYQPGLVSPDYATLSPKSKADPEFFVNLFKTNLYRARFRQESKGLGTGMSGFLRLYSDRFGTIEVPVPPLTDQKAIVRFIRYFDARLNQLLKAKAQLIDLLTEQAHRLTLRGCAVECEERSGLLLGKIPSKWRALPAKRIFQEVKRTNCPDEQLLAVTQDRGVLPKNMCEQNYVSPGGELDGLKLVSCDDFVISLRSFQGGIEHSRYQGIVSPAYSVIRLRPEFSTPENIRYYRYLLKSPMFISLLNTVISGIRDGKNILFSDFGELVLPIPTLTDVRAMLPAFDRLEAVKERFDMERPLLGEYRTRLVSDIVTGQLDVTHLDLPDIDRVEVIVSPEVYEAEDETEPELMGVQ